MSLNNMELIIKIPCNDGIEMENRLNRAIDDFGKVLKKRGFSPMNLVAHEDIDDTISEIYTVSLEPITK